VLEVNDEIRHLIGARAEAQTLAETARRAGMVTMFEHGVAKCRAGITSAAEILRVTMAS
jgi:general secretion pathway protein E